MAAFLLGWTAGPALLAGPASSLGRRVCGSEAVPACSSDVDDYR